MYGKYAAQSELLKNGIDTKACAFRPETRAQMRAALSLGNEKVFGHVGRFNDQKNHSFLIEAFAAYRKTNPDSVLLLVGEGVLQPQIEAQVNAAGLSESVRFLGLRNDVAALLSAMDVFLLPSKFEGLPLVLVEAQASGLSCLAADTVSPMANLSAGYLRFLPLETDVWVRAMGEAPVERSADAATIVAQCGFDSRTQAEKLQAFYLANGESV